MFRNTWGVFCPLSVFCLCLCAAVYLPVIQSFIRHLLMFINHWLWDRHAPSGYSTNIHTQDPDTFQCMQTEGPHTLCHFELSQTKVDNWGRNMEKSLVINPNLCPRSHCETHPLPHVCVKFWPKFRTKISQCDFCYDTRLINLSEYSAQYP